MAKVLGLLFCTVLTVALGFAWVCYELSKLSDIGSSISPTPLTTVSLTDMGVSESPVLGPWPPQLGETYPDLLLSDSNGNPFQLSDLRGKVILMELAAVSCKGCQAFAGGNRCGAYGDHGVQRGLKSIHEYADQYANVDLAKDDVVLVQVILYGGRLGAPSKEEVAGWAKHFKVPGDRNTIVLQGDASMLGRETYGMIPGFQLIDRQFKLCYDSAGHSPQHNLYRDLLPALGKMVR